MIFCHCAVVGDREVKRAVDAGARTVSQVCRSTGAGQECGSCVFAVRRVVCEHLAQVAVMAAADPEVDVAAS